MKYRTARCHIHVNNQLIPAIHKEKEEKKKEKKETKEKEKKKEKEKEEEEEEKKKKKKKKNIVLCSFHHQCNSNVRGTVKPRFTNASDHEQFGLRTNFPNTKRLG